VISPAAAKSSFRRKYQLEKEPTTMATTKKDRKQKSDRRQLAISITCIVIVAAMLLTSLITLLPIYN
jgi:hypothetical protein